jgi:hypothetical protein
MVKPINRAERGEIKVNKNVGKDYENDSDELDY